jgi:hypothetical protein
MVVVRNWVLYHTLMPFKFFRSQNFKTLLLLAVMHVRVAGCHLNGFNPEIPGFSTLAFCKVYIYPHPPSIHSQYSLLFSIFLVNTGGNPKCLVREPVVDRVSLPDQTTFKIS